MIDLGQCDLLKPHNTPSQTGPMHQFQSRSYRREDIPQPSLGQM